MASTGWALTEATPTKLVTLNRNLGRRCNIEVHLGGIEAGQTRVTVRGSVIGYFLGKELRSMVNQLRNAIEVSAHRLSTTGADNASRQHVQPEQPQFTAGWFRNPEGSGERYWDGTR